MKTVGIIGGSGYTGGELIRILLNHSAIAIDFVYSTTQAGNKISSAHPDLIGQTELKFSQTVNPDVDVVFLCLGHGNSTSFLQQNHFSNNTKIIDLSNDFRLKADACFEDRVFVYGLPELQKESIKAANNIANPGCFATAIQLALLPLAKEGLLSSNMHTNAVTGSTGAGVKPTNTTHFSWRNNNVSWYKPFTHQHLDEIKESLNYWEKPLGDVLFLPNRGNFARGIFATTYIEFDDNLALAYDLYDTFYEDAKFTQVSKIPIHLKQVVNTNQCHIHLHQHQHYLLITSIIDNLLKGASGQAVQNMNLMFGFPEDQGLQLKGTFF